MSVRFLESIEVIGQGSHDEIIILSVENKEAVGNCTVEVGKAEQVLRCVDRYVPYLRSTGMALTERHSACGEGVTPTFFIRTDTD